jgi:Co/Zn/Cd efflux system component
MKNILVKLLIIAIVAGIVIWLWRSGIISGAIAWLVALLVGLFGGHEVQRGKVKEHANEVDRLVKEMQEADRRVKDLRKQHNEEVKRVEEKHRDHSLDELLTSANDRERRRADTSD